MAILSFLFISICALFIPTDEILSNFNRLRYKYRSKYRRGKDLLIELSQLNLMGELTHLSQYKFYDQLICEIALVAKEFGAATSKTLAKFRHALSNDLQIEKKLSGTISESYFQFVMAWALTFFLSIFSSQTLGVSVDYLFLSLAAIYNFAGAISFILLIKKLEMKSLFPVSKALHSFLIFKLMYEVGTPLNYLIKRSKINELVDVNFAFTQDLYRRLAALIEFRQNQGVDIKEDLESIEIGLWDEYRAQNESLSQKVKILKFVWLVVFFFIPYVGNFFRLVSHLNL